MLGGAKVCCSRRAAFPTRSMWLQLGFRPSRIRLGPPPPEARHERCRKCLLGASAACLCTSGEVDSAANVGPSTQRGGDGSEARGAVKQRRNGRDDKRGGRDGSAVGSSARRRATRPQLHAVLALRAAGRGGDSGLAQHQARSKRCYAYRMYAAGHPWPVCLQAAEDWEKKHERAQAHKHQSIRQVWGTVGVVWHGHAGVRRRAPFVLL